MWIKCYDEMINTNSIKKYYWEGNNNYEIDNGLVIFFIGEKHGTYYRRTQDKGKELFNLLNRYIVEQND